MFKREQVDNVAVIDRAPYGKEAMGDFCTDVDPALTEGLPGPNFWVLSLTYQSRHEAKSGQAA